MPNQNTKLESAKSLGISETLYPFEAKGQSKYLEINGFQMHYVDVGPKDAPVLICVHGNPTWSFYYRNVCMALESQYRVFAIDHIGCGLSEKPSEQDYPYTLTRRVEDFSQWVAQLQSIEAFQTFSLLVHDWGGMIGGAYAAAHPENIEKLIILNTASFHKPKTKKLPFTLGLVRNTFLGKCLVLGLNAFSGMAVYWAVKKSLASDVKHGFTAPYHSWKTRVATYQFVKNIPLFEGDDSYDLVTQTEQKLSGLTAKPMLILWGEKDFVFDQHFLADWRQYFPNASVKTYPNGGHYILEDETESVISEIKQWLKSKS
jgi:pimeloyl-ACP methyl ester carboxylesterase